MANPGTLQTFDLNVGIRLEIEDAIYLISPYDVPFQGGSDIDGNAVLPTQTVDEVKVEWLDEVLLTPQSTLASGNMNNTDSSTTITVATGDGNHFIVGDVIQIDAEQMLVSAYGGSADQLVLTRAQFGTSKAAHTTGVTLFSVGTALAEGSDPGSARAVDRVDRVNYTQIFGPTAVTVSATENVVRKYGLQTTEFDHQAANRMREDLIRVERAIVNGRPTAGSASVGRTMGGMLYYITTNVDSSTTAISDTAIATLAQECFDQGGRPDRLVLGSTQKRKASYIQSTEIRYAQDTNRRGQRVDYLDTDFGNITLVLNRWMLPAQGILFAREQASLAILRPMQFEMLAKTGDSLKGQIVQEKSMRFRRQQWAAAFSALT